jgi:hypothetical protein
MEMDLSTAAQAYGALIGLDVRFRSKADICSAKRHVRFTPTLTKCLVLLLLRASAAFR